MADTDIYRDIACRTDGSIMLGVVGPVRTGKSTFIKRFMELLVLPNIEDVYARERARDELPQSGSGRTIMTAEPKFVPEDAAEISLGDDTHFSVRLIDCVGYMVNGASGQLEDGKERMVTTPWFDHEISMTEAAESGTSKVITEHSTIGLVITTDGSICDIPRADYAQPEERVINELKSLGKPFAVLINSAEPEGQEARELQRELSEKYSVPCMLTNCKRLSEENIRDILGTVLREFPVSELAVRLPSWVNALDDENGLKQRVYELLMSAAEDAHKMSGTDAMLSILNESELIESVSSSTDLGTGRIELRLDMPRSLYYEIISSETGLSIGNDGELMSFLREMSNIRSDYEHIRDALNDVREKGYGVVMPSADELELSEPEIVKQGGKYAVRLKARSSAIHMLKTAIETEVMPTIGGESASDEIIGFLLQGYEGDMSRLWESNIFGRPLYEIAEEGIADRISNLPENARAKLQDTLQRITNEGRGTLICILL